MVLLLMVPHNGGAVSPVDRCGAEIVLLFYFVILIKVSSTIAINIEESPSIDWCPFSGLTEDLKNLLGMAVLDMHFCFLSFLSSQGRASFLPALMTSLHKARKKSFSYCARGREERRWQTKHNGGMNFKGKVTALKLPSTKHETEKKNKKGA